MICKKCNSVIKDDARFCPMCGVEIEQLIQNQSAQMYTTSQQNQQIYSNSGQDIQNREMASVPVNNQMQGAYIPNQTTGTNVVNQKNPKKKASNKGLKTLFFLLFIFNLIAIAIIMFRGGGSTIDIAENIIEAEPKIDKEVKEDWSKGAYSLDKLGKQEEQFKFFMELDNSVKDTPVEKVCVSEDGMPYSVSTAPTIDDLYGLWYFYGNKKSPSDFDFSSLQSASNEDYYLFFYDETSLIDFSSASSNNMLLNLANMQYYIDGENIIIEDASSLEGEGIGFNIVLTGKNLLVQTIKDGQPLGDWRIYLKTSDDPSLVLNQFMQMEEESSERERDAFKNDTSNLIDAGNGCILYNVAMSSGVDESTYEPLDIKNVFSVDTPEICFSAKFEGADVESTVFLITWYYLENDFKMGEVKIPARYYNGPMYSSFTVPDKGWPLGKYKVTVSTDGVERGSVLFEVR